MKKTRTLPARLIPMEAILLVALVWLLTINRTEWIINFGILQADRYILLCWIAWGALTVALHVGVLIGSLKRKKHADAMPMKLTFAPDKVLAPDEIRRELQRFQADRPQLHDLLEQGIDQLDNITRKKHFYFVNG